MIQLKYVFAFFLILTAILSCDSDRVYEKNKRIDDRAWHKDSTVSFRFSINDINSTYSFYLNLRNSILYQYQNIYLSYSLEDTLGEVYHSDLINVQLFDSKTGAPLGDGMGDIFDHQYRVIEDYNFINPGVYQFNINHYMRQDTLMEIMAVGLRVEKTEIN